MTQRILWALGLLFAACLTTSAADDIDRLDSLLAAYDNAGGQKRLALGRDIIALSTQQEELVSTPLSIGDTMPRDSVDFIVWFAAERFYYANSYFEESLDYIDRALTLAKGNNVELHATLLCDRGYCLFKTSRNTAAAEAELEAERFAREHGQLMSLARSYNYLAIIDLSLGYFDEAKHFVGKALETDRLTGSDRNTHNYLGIACEVYNVAKEPDKAVEYGLQAVEAARRIGYDAGVVNHLSQLSYAYNRQGNLEKALEMSRQAVSTVEQMEIVDRNLLAISLEYVAFNLLDMKRNAEAVPVIRRAIALQQEMGNKRSVCYDHKSLAEALEPNDPRGALKAMRRYSQMMDSLHNDQMHQMLSRANAEVHNDVLQSENEQQRREKHIFIITSLIVALLALAVIAALVYAVRTRSRTVKTIRQLQAVREEFFTNITHEFRTPLTVIKGLSEQKEIPAITRNADHLLTLVNQLLDIAKVKASVGDARWERTDIVPQLAMLVENYQEAAHSRGVSLTFQPEAEPAVVDHVADYVQKMVDNLLVNALKYTAEGGSVVLSTHQEGGQLQIVVSDTGQGIHPDDLPHIFEPFYQSRHTPTSPGSGIGLAFCREIATASRATITAASILGQGSTFSVSMPLRQKDITPSTQSEPLRPVKVAVPMAPAAHNDPPVGEADTADDTSLRVLVVEDNRDVADYIGSVLEADYEVAYAADGEEGLQKAEQLVPDVILTDVMMPGMDGLELCRRIRDNMVTDHIPVIVITARVTDDDRLQGIEAGADAYLTKPFRPDELRLRITKLLEQRRRLIEKAQPQIAPTGSRHTSHDASALPFSERRAKNAPLFLDSLDEVILRLMAKGYVDATAVAKEMGMSLSQFTRKLRAVSGLSPAVYITRRRLEESCRLLEQGPESITDVAIQCGFADVAHFSHAFRRAYGVSPTQYMKEKTNN